MRIGAVLSVLLLCWSGVVRAADEGPVFLGPAPTRNFQPIQLIFLNLPFERAEPLAHRSVTLQISSAEINEIATTQGPIESVLKFETNRTVLSPRYGVAPGWEVGVDVSFISRFGGFMDPLIDAVESATGTSNPERDLYPHNTFGDFFVRRNGTPVFTGRAQSLEIGDVSLLAKRALPIGDGWPLLALRGAVKFPTGREGGVFGSGKTDVGFGLAADQRVWERLMVYGNLNLVFPGGPITPARLTLNPIFTESVAAEMSLTKRVAALVYEAAYTSPMHGTGVRLLDGTPVEIGVGVNLGWSPRLGLQLLAIDNVSPVEPAADFSFMLVATVRP